MGHCVLGNQALAKTKGGNPTVLGEWREYAKQWYVMIRVHVLVRDEM